jgi:L-lysine 6-transaminase
MLREQERILLLPSGVRSVRFRPALTISEDDLSIGLKGLDRCLRRLAVDRAASLPAAGD